MTRHTTRTDSTRTPAARAESIRRRAARAVKYGTTGGVR